MSEKTQDIMTAEEAKKKWCPMVRISIIQNDNGFRMAANRDITFLVPPNSFDPATDITKCIASDCMMWREDFCMMWRKDLTREEAQSGFHAALGHCGLAGNQRQSCP